MNNFKPCSARPRSLAQLSRYSHWHFFTICTACFKQIMKYVFSPPRICRHRHAKKDAENQNMATVGFRNAGVKVGVKVGLGVVAATGDTQYYVAVIRRGKGSRLETGPSSWCSQVQTALSLRKPRARDPLPLPASQRGARRRVGPAAGRGVLARAGEGSRLVVFFGL